MMTQKQRQLLEILKRQQGMMTVAEYAEKVGVSERTIHNYLHDMQSVFEENGLVLNRIPSRGIEVIKMQADTVREEMENDDFSMENRRHELIHRVLLKGERVNLPEFSDEYYVEEGTIRKDVSYLNSLLNNGITVTIENECIFVKTFKEADLVNALTYLCGMENQNDNFRRNVFADTVLDAVKEVLDEVGTFLQLNIADQYMQNISSALAVLCTRVADGNHIPEDESLLQFDKMKQMADILLSRQILGLLEEKLSIQFCDEDALFFSHYLRGDRIEVLSYNHIEEENRIIYQRILEKISSIINIQMSMEDDLVKEFVMHMNAMVYRLKHNITINNPLLEDIRKELGPLFNVIMMVVVSETSHLGIRISEDEIGYLTIHVQNIMEQQKKGRNILLVCPHGNVTANLILHQLKEILPAYNMFETISMNRITKVNLDSVDFIISTVDLPKLAKPVIRISPIVSNDDLMNITTFYQRMMIHDSLDHLTYPRLKAMLDEKYVFEYPNASKEEVLEQVLSILQEDGIVTKEYKESVYKREEIYSTDNAFLVAIPHGDIRHVKETKLVFAVLPKKKKWKKYYVNLVIFFNINQKDLSYSKDILEDIYKLMHSEQFGRLCREGITKEKLMKYILEGTI